VSARRESIIRGILLAVVNRRFPRRSPMRARSLSPPLLVLLSLSSVVMAVLPPSAVAGEPATRSPSGAIDSVLLQWRAQLKGCGQPAAAELYRLRDVDALLHVAMFEAANSIARRYTPFVAMVEAPPGASPEAAVAQAAHDVLTAQCPQATAAVATALVISLAEVRDDMARAGGVEVGRKAAAAALEARAASGANGVDPYWPEPAPGVFAYPAVERGRLWAKMTPWVMKTPDELRPPPPPALDSEKFLRALEEVQRVGSRRSAVRTRMQSDIADFWGANDVRFVVRQLVGLPGRSLVEDARFLALAEMAWTDTFVSMMDAKYAYNFWRPVTAIRHYARVGAPRLGGVALAIGDKDWEPFVPNPPHPEYTCGHCMSAAAVAAVIEAEFGARMPEIVIDRDNVLTRRFTSARDYADEVAAARLYGGVHYSFSIDAGRRAGYDIGRLAVERWFRPLQAR
jgi:hypothetical protein